MRTYRDSSSKRRSRSISQDQAAHREDLYYRKYDTKAHDKAEELRRRGERMDCDLRTVFVTKIHPRTTLREVWEFFSQAGIVEDIHMIEDNRSKRFKGLAYIEFSQREMISSALQLSGHYLKGHPIEVQMTEAERNRLEAVAPKLPVEDKGPTRVFIGRVHSSIVKDDLIPFFELFGRFSSFELTRDGTASVVFESDMEAQNAVCELDGVRLLGKGIDVSLNPLTDEQQLMPSAAKVLDSSSGGMHLTAASRAALRHKLQREEAPKLADTCVVLMDLFDPEEAIRGGRRFIDDLRYDVEPEVQRFGRIEDIYFNSSDGSVYIQFTSEDAAERAVSAFDGRFFALRQIRARIISKEEYDSQVPRMR